MRVEIRPGHGKTQGMFVDVNKGCCGEENVNFSAVVGCGRRLGQDRGRGWVCQEEVTACTQPRLLDRAAV